MNYSMWTYSDAAFDDYGLLGTPASETHNDGTTQLVWGPNLAHHDCDGLTYKVATMIRGEVWGATAYADSTGIATQALAYFGEFRPRDQWRGVRR